MSQSSITYTREWEWSFTLLEPSTELTDIFRLVDGKYQLIKKFTTEDSYRFELGDECSSEVDFAKVF